MAVSLKDLRGKVKRPVRAVRICLDGDLWAKHDELMRKLDELESGPSQKMGDKTGAVEVARELQAVEEAMRASSETVEFRGTSSYKLAEIQKRFPSEDKRLAWDADAGAHALLAACSVEPLTEDEAREFLEEAHAAVANKMFNAAWTATVGSIDVPFSGRASALIAGSGSN